MAPSCAAPCAEAAAPGGAKRPDEGGERPASPQPSPAPSPPPAGSPLFVRGRSELLGDGDVEWLTGALELPRVTHWGALYLSYRDGRSFNCLLYGHGGSHFVPGIVGRPQVLLAVRDTAGAVFGAYCGGVWKDPAMLDREAESERRMRARPGAALLAAPKGPQPDAGFHGTPDTALWTVSSERAVYRPTGRNSNFMLLQTGWPEAECNGIGLGGPRMGFHGLFIDRFLETGHSRGAPRCSTFGSPCLASAPDFRVDEVEAWLLGSEEEVGRVCQSTETVPRKSVLRNRDAQTDRQILMHAGREFHTEMGHSGISISAVR